MQFSNYTAFHHYSLCDGALFRIAHLRQFWPNFFHWAINCYWCQRQNVVKSGACFLDWRLLDFFSLLKRFILSYFNFFQMTKYTCCLLHGRGQAATWQVFTFVSLFVHMIFRIETNWDVAGLEWINLSVRKYALIIIQPYFMVVSSLDLVLKVSPSITMFIFLSAMIQHTKYLTESW